MYNKTNRGAMKATRTISEISVLKSYGNVCMCNMKKMNGNIEERVNHVWEIKIIMPMVGSTMAGR